MCRDIKFLENFKNSIIKEGCKGLFLLMGANGVGKTRILNCIFEHINEFGFDKENTIFIRDEDNDNLENKRGTDKVNFLKNASSSTNHINLCLSRRFFIDKVKVIEIPSKSNNKLINFLLSLRSWGSIELNKLPSGIKRICLFALKDSNKNLKNTKDNSNKRTCWIIDEVEKSLHPNYIKKVCRVLNDISKENCVILTTHSPIVLEAFSHLFKNFYLCSVNGSRRKPVIKKIWSKNVVENILQKFELNEKEFLIWMQTILNFNDMSKIFFSNNLLLIEGPSDKIILSNIIDDSFDIISMGGHNSWSTPIVILFYLIKFAKSEEDKKNINFFMLLDIDQKNEIKKEYLKKWSQLGFNLNENFFWIGKREDENYPNMEGFHFGWIERLCFRCKSKYENARKIVKNSNWGKSKKKIDRKLS